VDRVNRIDALFASLRAANRKAFTAFITAGDPSLEVTPGAMRALVDGGADLLELGIPFSDPESDGADIQAASMRALSGASPTRLVDVLAIAREFRSTDQKTPLVLMGYLNALLAMGVETFARHARQSGVDGVVLVNLPIEEFDEIRPAFEREKLHAVFLVAPTTSSQRAANIAEHASGFLYYVSLKGVTGASHLDVEDLAMQTARLRTLTDLPIQIGFGIRSPEVAAEVSSYADGLIVGSALVKRMAELEHSPDKIPHALRQMASEFRSAIDRASTH